MSEEGIIELYQKWLKNSFPKLEEWVNSEENGKCPLSQDEHGWLLSLTYDLQSKLAEAKEAHDKCDKKAAEEIDRLKAELEWCKKQAVIVHEVSASDALRDRDLWKQRCEKLAEALRDMWGQFSYQSKDGKGCSGGLSALENCEEALSEYEAFLSSSVGNITSTSKHTEDKL